MKRIVTWKGLKRAWRKKDSSTVYLADIPRILHSMPQSKESQIQSYVGKVWRPYTFFVFVGGQARAQLRHKEDAELFANALEHGIMTGAIVFEEHCFVCSSALDDLGYCPECQKDEGE